jgi:hypothetical protein
VTRPPGTGVWRSTTVAGAAVLMEVVWVGDDCGVVVAFTDPSTAAGASMAYPPIAATANARSTSTIVTRSPGHDRLAGRLDRGSRVDVDTNPS